MPGLRHRFFDADDLGQFTIRDCDRFFVEPLENIQVLFWCIELRKEPFQSRGYQNIRIDLRSFQFSFDTFVDYSRQTSIACFSNIATSGSNRRGATVFRVLAPPGTYRAAMSLRSLTISPVSQPCIMQQVNTHKFCGNLFSRSTCFAATTSKLVCLAGFGVNTSKYFRGRTIPGRITQRQFRRGLSKHHGSDELVRRYDMHSTSEGPMEKLAVVGIGDRQAFSLRAVTSSSSLRDIRSGDDHGENILFSIRLLAWWLLQRIEHFGIRKLA